MGDAAPRYGMGYRAAWLNHAGLVSRHYEIIFHAFDRELPNRPINVLDVGVENGGSVEVWQKILPDGSDVIGLDNRVECADLGVPVLTCDVLDEEQVRETLRGRWFDVIVDSTGVMSPWPWVFLRAGGKLILERYDTDVIAGLVRGVAEDSDGWLPIEEIMRVSVYPHVVVVEKRNPRVLPYVEAMVGNFAEVVDEASLIEAGVRRVII